MIRGRAPRLALWQAARRHCGEDSPVTRAKFGRYVAAMGGTLTAVSSGREAWVACYRGNGVAGFLNRGMRRHLARRTEPWSHSRQAWQLDP